MDLGLSGKVALITGGSRGIGKAIALALASEGTDIAILARNADRGLAAAKEIAKKTGRVVDFYAADTAKDDEVNAAVANVLADFGRIDILVNSAAEPAGRGPVPKLATVNDENFYEDFNVKMMGALRVARAVAPDMRARGWGRIINISGLAARQTGSIIGSIRNVALAALTKNLAEELGTAGINVTCVHPGVTLTERSPENFARMAAAADTTAEAVEQQIGSRTTIGRIVTAEEVANVVCFLASPKSVAINGDAIAAGGGVIGAIHY